MPVYEWQRAKALRRGDRVAVREGETFRAPESVGRAFSDLVAEQEDTGQGVDVDFDQLGNGAAGGQGENGEPPVDADEDGVADDVEETLDGTVDEVDDAIESGEYDDRLDELEAAERDRQDRKGVLDAIERRRDRLDRE